MNARSRRLVHWLSLGSASCCLLAGCSLTNSAQRDAASSMSQTQSPIATVMSNRVETDGPRDEGALAIAWARSFEKQHKYEDAERLYTKAMESPKHCVDAAHRLAKLQVRQGQVAEAERNYRRAVNTDPKNVEILTDFGYTCYLQARWAEAQDLLTKAIQIDPHHARAHNNLGLVYASQNLEEKAVQEFRRAGLGEAEVQVNLAMVQLSRGQQGRAREALKLAQQQDLHHPAVQRLMAELQPPADDRRISQPTLPRPDQTPPVTAALASHHAKPATTKATPSLAAARPYIPVQVTPTTATPTTNTTRAVTSGEVLPSRTTPPAADELRPVQPESVQQVVERAVAAAVKPAATSEPTGGHEPTSRSPDSVAPASFSDRPVPVARVRTVRAVTDLTEGVVPR